MGKIIDIRRQMGGKPLPYDAEVEYLKGDGHAFINTGIMLNSNDVLSGRMYKENNISSSSLFGACGISYTASSIFAYSTQYNTPYLRFNHATSVRQTRLPATGEFIFYESKDEIRVERIDGTIFGRTTLKVTSYYEISRECMLFKANGDGAALQGLRVMWFKIKDKIDMIPVRVGNTGYMYDKVSGKLFGNDGTGEFILGPDVMGGVILELIRPALGERRAA